MRAQRNAYGSLERPESRSMLAGDVLAALVAGNLQITGDASDNNIAVQQLAGGNWQVSGIGTTINGAAANFATAGVNSISINLNGGNDTLNLHTGSVAGAVSVIAAAGNDNLTVADLSVTGALTVDAGTGADVAAIQ